MKEIQLTKGYTAMVDDEDFEELSKYHWYAIISTHTNYAGCNVPNGHRHPPMMKMHRMITKCPNNMVVDHINHNGLDNRKENLRICTRKQNARNNASVSKFGYKGVCCSGGGNRISKPYKAQIRIDGKTKYLGCYSSPIEAAIKYDEVASGLFGEFALLNFPKNT